MTALLPCSELPSAYECFGNRPAYVRARKTIDRWGDDEGLQRQLGGPA